MKLTKEDKQLLEQIIKDYTWTKEDEENHKKIMKEIDEEFDEAIKRMLEHHKSKFKKGKFLVS